MIRPLPSSTLFPYTTLFRSMPAADLKKKFLDICRSNKQEYCLEVKEMDNPAISLLHQEDFSELLASYGGRSEEHTSELQSHSDLVCRLLLEKKKKIA